MSFTAIIIQNKEYKLRCNHKSLIAIKEHYELDSLSEVHSKIAELLTTVKLDYLLFALLQAFHAEEFKQPFKIESLIDDMDAGEYFAFLTGLVSKITHEFMRSMGLSEEQIHEQMKQSDEPIRQKKDLISETA